ncbi:hypothetical protein [Corynebacterium pygosceleis]|uniref:Secreted protein n=2 Tax=Corynebacterium pygosceleis TaxID=2800406 RepID=A0A9Q4GKC2_9CORY|nr:hypothetical protein [Corynebacterium pygosceleis]MCK7675091.1 hypothetical protein [Corynebacterium pygosceleis]MCX7444247.1 hypothetical protein [Corynebacterium pygosceleis]MCX7467270.1 hypothetical protein [Corynebacterium pygosceleis]
MTIRTRSAARIVAASLAVMALVACSGDDATAPAPVPEQETTSAAPVVEEKTPFVPQQVDPVLVDQNLNTPAHDPGLNVDWQIMSVNYGNYGGTVIHVLVTNRNDVALPVDAFAPPTLAISDYAGNLTEIQRMSEEQYPGLVSALDLPLGPGASTNLAYAFQTSYGALYNAEFRIGNVIFKGSLPRN